MRVLRRVGRVRLGMFLLLFGVMVNINTILKYYSTFLFIDGNEYDLTSALPGFLFFAKQCFHHDEITDCEDEDIPIDVYRSAFSGIFGGNWDDFVYASSIDDIVDYDNTLLYDADDDCRVLFPVYKKSFFELIFLKPNVSKWLLWQDTIYSIFTPQTQSTYIPITKHYTNLITRLTNALENLEEFPLNRHLEFPLRISRVLVRKIYIRRKLMDAYGSGDIKKMKGLVDDEVRELRGSVDRLLEWHRDVVWGENYKGFGSEIVEGRYNLPHQVFLFIYLGMGR